MRRPTSRQTGFSLVELVIVLSILGLLIAIGVPSVMSYMRTSRRVGAAQSLEGDFRYAHVVATTKQKTCIVVFASDHYDVKQVSPATTLLTRTMPRGVSCASTDTATFYAWGLTDPVTVTLSDQHDTSTVRLSSNGRIQ
jgi:type IV fimbrial biogenesis protein FimT